MLIRPLECFRATCPQILQSSRALSRVGPASQAVGHRGNCLQCDVQVLQLVAETPDYCLIARQLVAKNFDQPGHAPKVLRKLGILGRIAAASRSCISRVLKREWNRTRLHQLNDIVHALLLCVGWGREPITDRNN